MSLSFSADTDLVNHGSAAALDNLSPFTWAAWLYPTLIDTTSRRFIDKNGTSFLILNSGGNNNLLQAFVDYTGADCQVRSAANFMTTGEWQFVAFVDGGVGVLPLLFRGLPNTPCVQPGSYLIQQAGTGARGTTDAASDLCVGARPSTNNAFRGYIACVAVWNEALTQARLQAFQFDLRARGSGCILFAPYIGVGSGPAFDDAGGHHGAITGAVPVDDWPPALLAWHAARKRRRAA